MPMLQCALLRTQTRRCKAFPVWKHTLVLKCTLHMCIITAEYNGAMLQE